ncbi:MAG: transcriptional repressor [Lachnospiraceae bacterium]|nr:transcriptional repressor [Lachnospiraceae bacterium]
MVKYSRQRSCILSDLQSRYDHPTADMVYDSVRQKQPNISLGTVYRNLAQLVESGQILKITTGIGPDRFDGQTHEHIHFVCTECGDVVDMDYIPKERLSEEAAKGFDGKIEGYHLQFYGRCKKCQCGSKNLS